MKNWIVIVLLLTATWSQAQEKAIIDMVAGKVGSELILLSDIEAQFNLMSERNPNLPPETKCTIMENLLVNGLMLNQAKLDSIVVSDVEVEAQLDARIENILQYMNNDVKQFEDYYGQPINEVKNQFREDLKNQLLVQRTRQTVFSDITVTPSEVKAFFARIPEDSLPYFNAEVEIAEIVYKPKINEVERKKAKDELEILRTQVLEEGEDFAETARIYSDDPGSARVGGDLGWQRRGGFVQEFEAAAYNLEKGEYSKVIETEFGFHFLQLLERRGNSIKTRHILIRPEITQADLELAQNKLDSVRGLISTDSITFSRAVKRFSDDKQQSYNNDGNIVNSVTGNTFFEIGDLDPEIYFTIDTMDVGDVSAPFVFRQPNGEIYYRIIQLQSRTSPHKANLRQDYSKIKMAALESKKNNFINEWVGNKIGEAYISIGSTYDGCPNLQEWQDKSIKP